VAVAHSKKLVLRVAWKRRGWQREASMRERAVSHKDAETRLYVPLEERMAIG
jgi:hypothetical protein